MKHLHIETEEIKKGDDLTRDFLKTLDKNLFECGKRRATITYFLGLLITFFAFCHYFAVTKLAILGSEFQIAYGDIYWSGVIVLSVVYFYDTFLFSQEINLLFVLDAMYEGLELPKTLRDDRIIALTAFPSPISYLLHSGRADPPWPIILFNFTIGLAVLLFPIFFIGFFLYHGIKELGFAGMWLPLITVLSCLIIFCRFYRVMGNASYGLQSAQRFQRK